MRTCLRDAPFDFKVGVEVLGGMILKKKKKTIPFPSFQKKKNQTNKQNKTLTHLSVQEIMHWARCQNLNERPAISKIGEKNSPFLNYQPPPLESQMVHPSELSDHGDDTDFINTGNKIMVSWVRPRLYSLPQGSVQVWSNQSTLPISGGFCLLYYHDLRWPQQWGSAVVSLTAAS